MSIYKNITESNALVFGFVLNGKGGGLPLNDIDDDAKSIWCHLDFLEEGCNENLKALGIPEHVIDGLTRLDTRPRAIQFEEGILLILRVINLNPGEDPNDMVSLRLWVEKDRVISLRHKPVLSAQTINNELIKGVGPKSISEVISTVIERIADRIAEYVDELEARIAKSEDEAETENIVKTRSNVANLRREAAMVRRYLAPQREALEAFHRQSENLLEKDQHHYIQELSDRIIRYVEDLDLVREKAVVLQEELMNRMAQQQNERMYVLSIVAAIFLPISFVTGLFGMNVAGLPGLETPMAFAYVAGAMVIVVTGILLLFRYKKWL